ncbi:MAG TPA: guanylate kinase [Methylomirabilota bacterium]|nr:guanylate kinase [Methylomirabilota bacterium]
MSDDTDTIPFTFVRRGILFILSAPSGAGKTTLTHQILERTPDLRLSVSYTTRAPRPGEKEGRDYHFINEAQFEAMRTAGAFAEWAQVHGFLYGTARAPLDEALANSRDFLLDIDVQGARQLKTAYPEAISIFILPPSWRELEARLRSRGTDREEVITRRLQRAREETLALGSYDYMVVNDRVDRALAVLLGIIQAERARVSRLLSASSPLLIEALHLHQDKGAL